MSDTRLAPEDDVLLAVARTRAAREADTLTTLARARALLAQGPLWWTQGRERRDYAFSDWRSHPAYCAVGAIRAVSTSGPQFARVAAELAAVLPLTPEARIIAESGYRITTWNDAANRTYTEVLDAFDRALARVGIAP